MPDSKVGILIEARDSASSTIKNVKSGLNDLGKSAGEATSLAGAFTNLGGAIGLAAAAAGAFKVGQTVVELAQLGAQTERLETSFKTLSTQAGISSSLMLSSLRKASQGTISDTDLMLNANKALVLGVSKNADEISQLLEVAVARGKALGRSATDAFSDIITGIGRESPLILDNIGIKVADITKGIADYAAAHGKVVEALTGEERKQAIVNVAISSSAGLVRENAKAGKDAQTSIEQMSSAWTNIKTTVGQIIVPSAAPFLTGLADALDRLNRSLDRTEQLKGLVSARENPTTNGQAANDAEMYIQAAQAANNMAAATTQAFSSEADIYIKAGQAANGLGANTKQLASDQAALAATIMSSTSPSMKSLALDAYQVQSALAASSSGMYSQQAAAANLGASLAVLGGEYQRVIALQSAFAGASAQLSSLAGQVIGAAGQEAGLKFLRQQNAALSDQQKAWQDAGYSVAEVNALTYAYNENLRKGTEETYGFGAAATRANRAAAASIKALNAEYENLKSKVSSVISSAFSDTVGVNPDDILPRQNAVSEDARRLADVAVNGFASPWADYLANKFPDTIGAAFKSGGDVKQTAAQLLKDFQDGLRPELLDKNRAKELVKRAIIGEQNTKALTEEIAKELATEMGIGIAQAQSAAASVLGGSSIGGSGTATPEAKQIPIVPVIDTSKLPTTPVTISGTIDSVTVSQTVKDYTLSVAAQIATISIAETVTNPQIASTAAIGQIVIADGAAIPTPVLTGGLTIDAVSIRSDAELPTPSVAATIGILTLDAAVQSPQITIASVISSIAIAEGVKPPDIVLAAGAFVNVVSLASTAVLPDVTLTANIVAVQLDASAATETPLALSAKVTPFIDTSTMDQGNIDAARTFITEILPINVVPYVSTEGIDVSTPLAYLEQELAPIVTPYINYLGILPEDLDAAGMHIAGGIVAGIQKYNLGSAIVTELNNAQLAMRNSGITSGQNWGSGFNSGASEYITSIVATVVSLALAQIARTATKTGAS